MADLLLFGRLADARRAGQRRFRCFNAHLMHTVILGLQGKLVEITSLSLRIISLRSVAQLLKLSTICKSPLHGPRNYDDHTWKRSANYSARTDHGLKQFFLRISQQYYASPKKKEAHTICNNRPHTALFLVWSSESMGAFHSTKNSGNSGISVRNFRCASRACPNIPENRNNRKIL